MISEKVIRFRHPDYDPDQVQKSISSSVSRYLSSKSIHAFLSNLANRQTDKRRQSHLPPTTEEVNNAIESQTAVKTLVVQRLRHSGRPNDIEPKTVVK